LRLHREKNAALRDLGTRCKAKSATHQACYTGLSGCQGTRVAMQWPVTGSLDHLGNSGRKGNTGNQTCRILGLTPIPDAGQYTVAIVNGVGTTITTNASLVVLAPPTTPPAIPGLVAHLPFTHNSLTDTTGRGNSGHAVGSPTFVNDGLLGTALHYETTVDSTGTKASYVSLGVRPDLNFSSNVSFTVAFWVRLPLTAILAPAQSIYFVFAMVAGAHRSMSVTLNA